MIIAVGVAIEIFAFIIGVGFALKDPGLSNIGWIIMAIGFLVGLIGVIKK